MDHRRGVHHRFALFSCLWLCWAIASVEAFGDWSEPEENEVEDELSPAELQLKNTLKCHRRGYIRKVEQEDSMGRKCWDTLTLEACWGRCDSYEISEWKFPYKRSRHPVCSFGARVEGISHLKHCEEGAAPKAKIYRYVKPVTCRCRACSSIDTSCGWLPLNQD